MRRCHSELVERPAPPEVLVGPHREKRRPAARAQPGRHRASGMPRAGVTFEEMGDATDDLANLWRWFGEHQFRGYSPIYERIADAVAGDREVLELFREAPPAAHLPPAPLGAVRYLLLDGLDHPLGEVYGGRSDADPGPLFLDLCRTERAAAPRAAGDEAGADERLRAQRAHRTGPHLGGAAGSRVPTAWWMWERAPASTSSAIDTGWTTAAHGATGPADSPVRISCEVTGGDPPIADRLPALARRVGIDLSPIDVSDPSDARLAARLCVARHRSGRAGRGLHPAGAAGPADAGRGSCQ